MKTKMIDLRETIMMKHQVEVITNRKKRRREEDENPNNIFEIYL